MSGKVTDKAAYSLQHLSCSRRKQTICDVVVIFLLAFAVAEAELVYQSSVSPIQLDAQIRAHSSVSGGQLKAQKLVGGISTVQPSLAFAFGPGGLLCPYLFGVAFELRDQGLIHSSTPVGGASAGAVVAAAMAFGKKESDVLTSIGQFMKEARSGVSLKTAFSRVLQAMVPEDAAERAQRQGLAIGYYEVFPHQRSHIVTSWKSKEDMIETILASMNFPFYFSQWPLVKCRDAWAVDGLWSVDRTRYGCPPLPGNRTIAIVAMPDVRTIFNSSDIIQPGHLGMELPDDISTSQWKWWMMSPAPDEKVQEMIKVGRAHARAWAAEQHFLPALEKWRLHAEEVNTDELKGTKTAPLVNSTLSLPEPLQASETLWALPQWLQPLCSLQIPSQWTLAQTSPNMIRIPAAVLIALFTIIGITFVVLRLGCGGTLTASDEPLLATYRQVE